MRLWLPALMVSLLVAGCASSTQPPAAVVDPVQVLREGGAAMGALKTVSATLKFTQGKVSFQGFTLTGAKTSVRLPGDSDTVYNVRDQDLAFNVEVVIVGGRTWVQLPLSTLQEITGPQAAAIPDLAKFFDPTSGLPAVLPAGHNPKYTGQETIDGVATQVISATYTSDQVHAMLTQLTSSADIQAQIWLGASDHLVRKAILSGAFGDGGQASSVEVDISGFNAAVSITSPSP
jgi:LppX_LprAFG lipoprotein